MFEVAELTEIRKKAMDLLARREHSVFELERKLQARGYDEDAIGEAVEGLRRDRLLSDERFVEAYVHQRGNAGVGPIKIGYELRQKGIADGLIEAYLDPRDEAWDESMRHQRARRFGEAIPDDYATRVKQARFLQNRGFSPAAVMRLFR